MLTESQLIESCLKGDKHAFGQLVEPLLPKAYRTALGILGSSHLAEDAVQNALLEAYTIIISGKRFTNFSSWFTRLVASRALDLARKHFKEVKRTFNLDDFDPVTHSNEPGEVLLRNEQYAECINLIQSLNINHRIVLTLYYFQEYSIDEIAAMLHTNSNTIKTRLSRGRKAMQKLALTNKQKRGGIHNGI